MSRIARLLITQVLLFHFLLSATAFGMLGFWLLIIGRATWSLGHLPIPMINDPKIILPYDDVYQYLFDGLYTIGLLTPVGISVLALALAFAVKMLLKRTMGQDLPSINSILYWCSVWGWLMISTVGFRFYVWIVD